MEKMLDFMPAEEIADRFMALYHGQTDFAMTDTGKPYIIFRINDTGVCLCEDEGVFMQNIEKTGDYINVGGRQELAFYSLPEAYQHFMKLLAENDANSAFDEKWLRQTCAYNIYRYNFSRNFEDYKLLLASIKPFMKDNEMFDMYDIFGRALEIMYVPEQKIYLVFLYRKGHYDCLYFSDSFELYKSVPVIDKDEVIKEARQYKIKDEQDGAL